MAPPSDRPPAKSPDSARAFVFSYLTTPALEAQEKEGWRRLPNPGEKAPLRR